LEKQKILFLCTGNSCRSQMAEAFLRKYSTDQFEVYSAGLEPKPIHPLTYQVMQEVGNNLSGHTSKRITDLPLREFDTLITVCDDADKNCPVGLVPSRDRLHWSFEDPAIFPGSEEERLDKFREVRDLIEKKVLDWVSEKNPDLPKF
jgi:arsenate reductase